MGAIVLYAATATAILLVWSRGVQKVSRGAAIALALLPLCITGRALLTGRVYGPIDLPFMAEPLRALASRYGVTISNAVLSDIYAQMIPWQAALRHAWSSGAWPLLNPFILCGDVLAAAYQPAPYDPFNLLALLIPLPSAITYSATMTFFIAAFSMFAFARAIGLREEAAMVGAAAWMFCAPVAFFVEWPLTRAWAYLPLVLFGVRSVVSVPSFKNSAIFTTSLLLLILAGHPETVLHVVAIGALYGIVELATVRRESPRALVHLVSCGVLASTLTAFAWMPLLEAAPQTTEYGVRNGIYKHTAWPAMPEITKRRIASSFLPSWGGQPWRGAITSDFDANNWRVGAVALALAIAALIWARRRETWFFAGVAVICAWAGANALPVARILHALPLFDITLNERLAWAAAFALALLGAIAADAWPESRQLRAAGAVVTAVLATVLVIADHDRLVIAEAVPLAVVALMLILRTPARIAVPLLCGLVLIQRAIVDGGIYPTLPKNAFYPDVPLFRSIPRPNREPFRVAGVGFTMIPNGLTLYGLEDARGYNAMTFKRLYETFPLWSTPQVASFNVIEDPKRPFLSFLNIRWFIDGNALIENRAALPRAFVPQHIAFVKNAMPPMLRASDFRTEAWIEVPEQRSVEFENAPGRVVTTRVPNGFDLDASMQGDGWIVVSETAWKGWRAYIDGRRVQWRFANHAFIGVYVPSGVHRVTLRYLPESFTRGRAISLLSLAGIFLWGMARRFLMRNDDDRRELVASRQTFRS